MVSILKKSAPEPTVSTDSFRARFYVPKCEEFTHIILYILYILYIIYICIIYILYILYILYWHDWLSPINLYASWGHSFTLNMSCGRVYGPFEVGCDLTIWVKSQKMFKKNIRYMNNSWIYIYTHTYIHTYIYIHNYIWAYHNLEMKIHKSHLSLWGGRA